MLLYMKTSKVILGFNLAWPPDGNKIELLPAVLQAELPLLVSLPGMMRTEHRCLRHLSRITFHMCLGNVGMV